MNTEEKNGFILLDKPKGPTSFDMVYKLRKITGIKKIGHAGTLDPFASGLLVMAIGRRATREISRYVKMDKSYLADLCLGAVSTTHDPEGEITKMNVEKVPNKDEVIAVLEKFKGRQKQIPPMFSAKKINGQKLYDLARKGKVVKREAVEIDIKKIHLLEYDWPKLKIEVICSSGTYVRSLAYDIGESLGVGAYLSDLRRTEVGSMKVREACHIKDLEDENWRNYIFKEL